MIYDQKLKELSFLVYGLGLSGCSVVKFFKKNRINNFQVWDDKEKKLYKNTNLIIDSGFIGLKTGWTSDAGLTFIGFNQENNKIWLLPPY